jgi:hypothetical protein
MSQDPENQPFSESHLDSPEYRKRLMRKLNTLIAVLEVACAKVRRSLAGPDPDVERLNRIHKNLQDTLQVCMRAKGALERSEQLPEELPSQLTQVANARDGEVELSAGDLGRPGGRVVEMSSLEEAERFQRLGPISAKEICSVDLDDLCQRLLG